MAALHTDRLVLREPAPDDADFMVELLNEPDFLRFIGDRGVRTTDEAREYLRTGPLDHFRRLGFGMWVVEPKGGGYPLGICSLLQREWLDDVDLGFAFLSRHRSQGYAFESAKAVLADSRDRLGIDRVLAFTARDNAVSIALLGKLGFAQAGTTTVPDDDEELLLWSHQQDGSESLS